MSLENLSPEGRFVVRQKVERLEAITGIETRNRYEVLTPDGRAVALAYEESGTMSRLFLETHRPLTLHIADLNGQDILVASRGFFLFFMHLRVHDADGRAIGGIRRKWGFLKRRMVIEDSAGNPVAEVSGSVFRRYTFTIRQNGQEIGRITKRWSGLGREMFTDADTFLVEMPIGHGDDDFQSLALATAFAVDLDFFERS